MTFRTRLLLIFSLAIAAAVAVVEIIGSSRAREVFEIAENHRMAALVAQFDKEFARRGQDIARTVESIAASPTAHDVALNPDPKEYVDQAAALAQTHRLDILDLVTSDGSIVSSAESPARFGYKEEWLAAQAPPTGSFLKIQEMPEGEALALMSVGIARAGGNTLYVSGGQNLDREFLASLVMPQGMRVLLYRKLDPQFATADVIDSVGPAPDTARLRPVIAEVEREGRDLTRTVGTGAAAETFFARRLIGYQNNLLGVLLIGSSRRELVEMESSMLRTAVIVAAAGILMGIALSWWATARISRPVRRLAESAGKVAAGNWGTTVAVSSRDEIGQLATAFNRMTHELVEQRDRLVQAERVAAWRELARRLAHELKNPLFPLQITVENMQRARESYPEQFDEVFREGSATLLAELANLKQIISRFSDFAKMPAPEMQPVNLSELAAETLKLFEPQFARAAIRPNVAFDPATSPVQADPEQITRVIRNLILNAIDAMPAGGTLTIRTIALSPSTVRLEISDTGQGLTPEECERLFTPYYTTKTHGTGLGLAIVQSVISDHKGKISVESKKGKGSTFRIDLSTAAS